MKAARSQKNLSKAELIVPEWAHSDLLTELPNRRRFTEHLDQAAAIRPGHRQRHDKSTDRRR
jgi:GGDEF domain-containing protein